MTSTTDVSAEAVEALTLQLQREIAKRRLAEQALEEREQIYLKAIGSADGVAYQLDFASNTYTFISDRLEQLTGFPPGEFRAAMWKDIIQTTVLRGDAAGLSLEEAKQRFRTGQMSVWQADYLCRCADGRTAWFSDASAPIRDEQGNITGCLGFLQDISQRKEAATKMRRLEAELSRAWHIASIGELVASLAHEIHQPLGAIANYAQGCARALESGEFDSGELLDVARTISDESLRAGKVLRKLRDLISPGNNARETVDLNDVLREVVAIVDRTARERQVQFEATCDLALRPVCVDRIQIQQVLLNLVQNAFDAVADAEPGDRKVTVKSFLGKEGFIQVDIGDTGKGISPDKLTEAFEPYFTTKPDGIGMGLAISRTMIESHGGEIWGTVNDGGRGMTFSFLVPCVSG